EHGLPDAFDGELTHQLRLDDIFHRRAHARTDQDLSGQGLIAQARGNICDSADGRVVEPALETDGTERREAMLDADPETDIVSETAPLLGQNADRLTHLERHQH